MSAGAAAGPRTALREAEGAAVCRWDEQRAEALLAGDMNVPHQKFISNTGQDWLEGDIVAKSFIHPNFMCKSKDNDSERDNHRSVSLFCCIFLIRLKA